ncbi:MAG: hypothetical protein KJ950_11215 [Proteobacteria bacterium]|nr:hypothetical protein [Pseudomonadota bacterium]MBU1688298.1 hypothetical protein [Pseudomonadota bacterium]
MNENQKKDQAKDTGMALILILLILFKILRQDYYLIAAVVVLLVNMTRPQLFQPLARLWFGLSNVLGGVGSRVLLTIVFYGMITPVGLIRRFSGTDPMKFKRWKDGTGSVFVDRSHQYTRTDIERPF